MTPTSTSKRTAVMAQGFRSLATLAVALAVAFLVIISISRSPGHAFWTLLSAPLSSQCTVGLWIDDFAKLTVAGLAYCLVFQARQFSIGVQGQAYVGALFAALVAMSPIGGTSAAIPTAVVVAMTAGAVYGFIPGFAKAKFGANEIVSSLMLNYIAIRVVNYVIRAHLAPKGSGHLGTDAFPTQSIFPALISGTRVDMGLIVALVCVLAVWFVLYRTSFGLKVRLVGHNSSFAEYAGLRARVIMVGAMAASGAVAGLLGANFVLGRAFGRLDSDFDGNLAFDAILVAIVARSHPLGVPFVALLYGYLRQGAQLMGIRTDVPTEMISVVQAIIILLVASSLSLPGRSFWARRIGRRAAVGFGSSEISAK